ncbi:MAG TPA: class I SAM-dependent methyltransferase [Actinomycetota bacterium]|nr:class I SAM-dependent methyltransferase [Actinomycetota bacterium]
MSGSIAFDRAADYYDETRGLSVEGVRRTTEALSEAFRGAGPILEVGVGTGQVAMPLAAAGVEVVGLDLSRPMLSKLVAKAGGTPPFPLVEGDATRMPYVDDAFTGAYLRWVLHLIPDWRAAVTEIVRVVAPGGRFLAALGSYGGMRSEIQARFADITGISTAPVGLMWDGGDELDDLMRARGARKEADITLSERDRDDLETFMRAVEANRFSWTWAVADDAVRADAAREARSWAEERWGPLERVPRETFEWTFAVYRLA